MNAKIAAVQMISGPDVEPNLATAGRLIAEAAAAGAQLVALPEYFPLIGATDIDRLAAREADGSGPIQDFLAGAAQKHGLWLVGGSIPLQANDPAKLRNACLVFDPQGKRVARYDKIHLFGFNKGDEAYDEAATIERGDQLVSFDSPLGRVGIAICYDLRFPELFRAMAQLPNPVDLLVLPAAFTETTGRAHWEMLLRARAVENQCYVLAAAQGGRHPNGRMTHGNSMVIDPWGEVLARMDKGEGVVMAELNRERLVDIRTSLPALKHRIL
ncbi:MAG: nitrilase/cyanide hydratase/apolipoprotein N-acyltransferase [Rhodocyclaceae bacterium]|nr:MAG: nitrilase/cyanide hydratase/apolipoprotein N-acyltransferase [Rhodocyclaceae bacterium]TND00776.1 MAG: nitrilase/cyanide hydratase/apolipoprotein N-acyltransferase [Rhodocyclaceae bacterium]